MLLRSDLVPLKRPDAVSAGPIIIPCVGSYQKSFIPVLTELRKPIGLPSRLLAPKKLNMLRFNYCL